MKRLGLVFFLLLSTSEASSCLHKEEASDETSIMLNCHEINTKNFNGYEGTDFHGTPYVINKTQFISYVED